MITLYCSTVGVHVMLDDAAETARRCREWAWAFITPCGPYTWIIAQVPLPPSTTAAELARVRGVWVTACTVPLPEEAEA